MPVAEMPVGKAVHQPVSERVELSGDVAAVSAAARIVSAQAKLYGITGRESIKPALPRTVVVSPEELALGI